MPSTVRELPVLTDGNPDNVISVVGEDAVMPEVEPNSMAKNGTEQTSKGVTQGRKVHPVVRVNSQPDTLGGSPSKKFSERLSEQLQGRNSEETLQNLKSRVAKQRWKRASLAAKVVVDIEKAEEKAANAKTNLRIIEGVVFFVFLFALTVFMLGSRDNRQVYIFRQSAIRIMLDERVVPTDATSVTFYEINSIDHVWSFLENILLPNMLDSSASPFLQTEAQLIAPIRVRNVRIDNSSCTLFDGNSGTCYPEFSPTVRQTNDFPDATWPSEDWGKFSKVKYSTNNGANSAFSHEYGPSGYVLQLSETLSRARAQIDDVKSRTWATYKNSRAVYVDFALYIPSSNLVWQGTFLFEIPSLGGVLPKFSFRFVRLFPLARPSSMAWTIVSWTVYFLALVLIIFEVVKARMVGPKVYFRQGETLLSWLNYAFLIAAATFESVALLQAINFANSDAGTRSRISLPGIASNLLFVSWISSFNCVFSWLRATTYLDVISPRMRQLVGTLNRASSDLSILLVLFFFIFFGFGVGFYRAFGEYIAQFSSISNALLTLFRTLTGDFEGFSDIVSFNRFLGPIMMVSFLLLVFFVILNMVLAVVLKSYEEVSEELKKQAAKERKTLKRLFGQQRDKAIEELKQRVNKADTSGDHKLTEDELSAIFETNGGQLKAMGVFSPQELLLRAGTPGNDYLTVEQIQTFLESISLGQATGQADIDDIDDDDLSVASAARHGAAIDPGVIRSVINAEVSLQLDKAVSEIKLFTQTEIQKAILTIAKLEEPDEVPPAPARDPSTGFIRTLAH